MFSHSMFQIARKAFHITLYAFLLTIGLLYSNLSLTALECSTNSSLDKSTQKLGKKLVTRFWNDVKHQDVDAYANLITENFHGISIQGIYDKCQQVTGLQNLTVTKFKLKNLIAVRYNNTLEISYLFFAEGKGIVSGPSIDIWHKKGKHWKIISHTYVPFLDQ